MKYLVGTILVTSDWISAVIPIRI